jgi:3-deoxy-D-manno-octulosonic-acid transferase
MIFAYSLLLRVSLVYYYFLSFFNAKARNTITGRRRLLEEISEHYRQIDRMRKRVLIHVSSFGELEQAKPLIAEMKRQFENIHIHLTFFSPSGYTNAKGKYNAPDLITYLPFDTRANVRRLIDGVKPDVVLFARYDLWPNLVFELKRRGIITVLFSATYRSKNFPFARQFYKKVYGSLSAIFTINSDVKESLLGIGIQNEKLTAAGDTRVDQVLRRREEAASEENILPENISQKITENSQFVFIAGSTWKEDEDMLALWIKSHETSRDMFTIIVPHEVTREHIESIRSLFGDRAVLFSEINTFKEHQILIWNRIGDLFLLYKYSDLAYVGGGFGAGVHNVLEPAAWGVASIVGPRHGRSFEISKLIGRGATYLVNNTTEFSDIAESLFGNRALLKKSGEEASAYLRENIGATEKIILYLKENTTLAQEFS